MSTAKTVSGRNYNFDNFYHFLKTELVKFLVFVLASPGQSRGFVNEQLNIAGMTEIIPHIIIHSV